LRGAAAVSVRGATRDAALGPDVATPVVGGPRLEALQLPVEERETVDGCLRQMDFLEPELAELERLIALDALASPEVTRLMSVVNVIARSVRDWQQRTRAPTRHGGRASSSRLSRKQRGEASVSDPAL
jgi:hypothetical protein